MTLARPWVCLLLTLPALGCRETPRGANRATAIPQGTSSEIRVTDSAAKSAAVFTQAFYEWYRRHNDRLETAIAEQPALFGPELLAALRADIEAQAKSPGEIVGLDWDPFTASQDPCDPYRVDRITRRGDTIVVAVRGMCTDAAPRPGPAVFAELHHTASGWVFVNFREPGDTNSLLDHLALLRREREANTARRPH